jgi:CBS domain
MRDPESAPSAGSQNSGLSARAEAAASVAQAMVTNPKVFGPALLRSDLDELFTDDHVHAALVVDDGRLITVVERTDLKEGLPDVDPCSLGTLTGRVVAPEAPLAAVHARMRHEQRRRLAVIDEAGRLLGLLCLKKSGTGFCSDADVRSRELERDRVRLPLFPIPLFPVELGCRERRRTVPNGAASSPGWLGVSLAAWN